MRIREFIFGPQSCRTCGQLGDNEHIFIINELCAECAAEAKGGSRLTGSKQGKPLGGGSRFSWKDCKGCYELAPGLDKDGYCDWCNTDGGGSPKKEFSIPHRVSLGESEPGDTVVIRCGCRHRVELDTKKKIPCLVSEGTKWCEAHKDGPAKWPHFEGNRTYQPLRVVIVRRKGFKTKGKNAH